MYFLYLPYLLHAAPVSPSLVLSLQQFTLHITKYIILSFEHRSQQKKGSTVNVYYLETQSLLS